MVVEGVSVFVQKVLTDFSRYVIFLFPNVLVSPQVELKSREGRRRKVKGGEEEEEEGEEGGEKKEEQMWMREDREKMDSKEREREGMEKGCGQNGCVI